MLMLMLEEMKVKIVISNPESLLRRTNLTSYCGICNKKRNFAYFFQGESIRRKSLLDPQTLLLLKSQEESHM